MLFPTDLIPPEQTPQATPFSAHPQSKVALALLAQHQNKINAPAISAAIAIDGNIVWAGAVGWANIAAQIPATTDTQFRIGSSSKAVTATLLARMVQDGRIALDEPISTYYPQLPNAEWQKITLRHLASHTSGLPDYIDNYGDVWGFYYLFKLDKRYTSVSESLEVFDDNALRFEPGSEYHYSTFNTVLQSAVLEATAGEAFFTTMRKEIFNPLGMHATGAEYELPEEALFPHPLIW